jgi:segregation and condensation protein B
VIIWPTASAKRGGTGVQQHEVKGVIEALLFANQHPLTVDNIMRIVGDQVEKKVVKKLLAELLAEYRGMERSFHLVEVGEGYQFRTKTEFAPWIRSLHKIKPARLRQSALETLAIVAYRQPVVRAEVEQIRGVDSGWVLSSLLEKGLIKILGRKEVPGRPLVYGTDRRFLEVFGLRDLSGLPTIQELDALKEEEQPEAPPEPIIEEEEGAA